MTFNLILFQTYIIFLFISLLGYGIIFNKYKNFICLSKNNLSFSELGFFSLLILIPISIIINFFMKIDYIVSSIFFILGLIFFFYEAIIKKNLNKVIIPIILIIILIPYFILSSHHDDFFYYHLPYLNVLQQSKIIIGLVNLNNVLVYPQNLWFNIFSLFRLPIIDFNGIQVINGIFTIFFLMFCFENLVRTKIVKLKIINLMFFIFTLVLFSRLKDHGAEIIPQFLMLVVIYYSFELILDKNIDKNEYLLKIILIFMSAVLLRLSSIVILPLILFIFIVNYKFISNLFKKFKFLFFISVLLFIVLSKNFVNSGCIVYPLSFTCFKQSEVSWSIGKEIPKINENVILSYTRGWMIYAKENSMQTSKFIFNPNENHLSHKEYLDKGFKFWFKFWVKDPDIIRIFNMFLVGFFVLIVLLINNLKKLDFRLKKLNNYKINLTILFIFFSLMFWLFFSTPSTRYGGYALFICLISLLISHLTTAMVNKDIKITISFVVVVLLSFSFFYIKNLQRIFNDNFEIPFPYNEELIRNIDYKTITFEDTNINLRLPTNKFKMGNLNETNNYILHCGNIEALCTPEKKIKCVKKIYKKYKYLFIINDKDGCINLHSQHALY